MQETLLLRLPEHGRQVSWLIVDALGNRVGPPQQGELAEAAPQAAGRRLCVIVAGENISLYRVQIPVRNAQKLLQAIPYALEDRLAEDVETLHFAPGPRDPHGCPVAVVKRARLQSWLAQLTEAGLEAVELVPDMLALPRRSERLILLAEEDRLLVRFPDGDGFAAELTLGPLLLEKRLAAHAGASPWRQASLYAADPQRVQALAAALRHHEVEVSLEPLPQGALGILAGGYRDGINLLQGEFSPRGTGQARWREWRPAAALTVALLGLLLVQQAVSYLQLRRQAASLQAATRSLFHQAVPDIHRDLDGPSMRTVMQQRLARLSGDSGGLPALLTVAAGALQQQPQVELSGFKYRDGSLQLQLRAPDTATLERLQSNLTANAAFKVSLDATSQSASGVVAELTLQERGS